ncbi:phage holin family protein [Luteococcus peritonei]|uniref:Phage holin family protein n=1 Tax=Luteococcus peritonei TaxID=88874 RepID=A0ABW4RWL7_9ACTN
MINERMDPKTLVNNIVVDTKSAAQDTVALAKAEIQPSAKAAGTAGGMFGGAGYLGANAASLLFLAGGLGFGLLFSHLFGWGPIAASALGLVAMALVLLIIAGIMALIGKGKLKDVKPPKAAITEAKKTVETLKGSLQRGVNSVDADVRDRKGLAQVKKAAKDVDEAGLSATTPAAPRHAATGTGTGATRVDQTRA